jgi:hypothetical protein
VGIEFAQFFKGPFFFWQLNEKGEQKVFTHTGKLPPQSLMLTCEVLAKRKNLHDVIQRIHELIHQRTEELNLIEQEEKTLKRDK